MTVSFDTSVDDFLHHIQYARGYSDHTLISYRTDLEQFKAFLVSRQELDTFPDRLTRLSIRAWIAHMSENSYSKTSVARKLSSLRSMFKYMVKTKTTENNPLVGIHLPRFEHRLPVVMTETDIAKLMNVMQSDMLFDARDKAIVEVLYSSGMRVSELVGMNHEHFVYDATNQEAHFTVFGKGKKERLLPTGTPAMNAVLHYVKLLKEKTPDTVTPHNPLFVNKFCTRLTTRGIARVVDKWARLAGVGHVPPHRLRHSFATHMLDRGANVRSVQELLGHENLHNTRVYEQCMRRT